MAWRVARSLLVLRDQINAAAPNRSKISDGLLGDASHSSRRSDHNPWVKEGHVGIVTALDITHDPAHGVNAGELADVLRRSGDVRIKYIISNRRIANSGHPWRPYSGANPHDKHFHVSVKSVKEYYDSEKPWPIGELTPVVDASPITDHPILRRGSIGESVRTLQGFLGVARDGDFGPKTEAALIEFQKESGLVPDGIAGPYVWTALV